TIQAGGRVEAGSADPAGGPPDGTRLARGPPDHPNGPAARERMMTDSRINQPRDPEIDRPASPDIGPGRERAGINPSQEPGIARPRSPDEPDPQPPDIERPQRETEHPERERPGPPA